MIRKINFDILRIICAFLVVLLHVSGSYWNCVASNSDYFISMTFYNGLSRSAVPLFVMISGMVMIPKDIQAKYLSKKILRLVGYFYLWSFFYAFQGLVFKLVLNDPVTLQDFLNSLQRFIYGHYHQWFLLMTVGLYLILPFVKKFCDDKKLMMYFIILWIVSTFITSLLPIQGITSQLQLSFIAGYIGYFILGYYLTQININQKYRIGLYIAGVLGAAYTVLKTIHDTRCTETYVDKHFSPFSWNVFLMAVALFIFFQYKSESQNKVFTQLAGTSLFVYMLHPFFIEKLNKIGIKVISGNPWWTVPLLSILIFGTCMVIALVLLRIKNYFIKVWK